MTSTDTTARTVAAVTAGVDVVLLVVAALLAVDTQITLSAPGDDGFAGLGYLVAGTVAVVALPSLLLAVVALCTRGAAAVACATLSVLVLVACAVVAVSWL